MNNYKILKNLDNVKKGKIGEEIARRYLVLIGMKIICSNYKTKFGEIDIIAKLENKIVFIEWVITWKKQKYTMLKTLMML